MQVMAAAQGCELLAFADHEQHFYRAILWYNKGHLIIRKGVET